MSPWTWECIGDAADSLADLPDPLKQEFERVIITRLQYL